MIIPNEAVKELIAEIPEGHRHIRTSIILQDGTEFTFHEATIANLQGLCYCQNTPFHEDSEIKRQKTRKQKTRICRMAIN